MQNKTMIQIPFDIRNILPNVSEQVKQEELIDKVPLNQFIEKADEINQLHLGNAGEIHEDISHIIKVDDNNLKAIGLGCLTGIHTFNGNYKKAIASINQALNLNTDEEVYAYILTEYANLLRQLKRIDDAMLLLEQASEITTNEKLEWRIKTYKGYCYRYSDKERSLDILKGAVRYYLDRNEHARYNTILRHIGLIYLQYNDFINSKKYLNEARTLAERYSHKSMMWDILNDEGWYFISNKEFDKAKKLYLGLVNIDKGPYLNSLVLQNLAYIEFEQNNHHKSIYYHKKSLKITSKYEIYEMLFEDYYKIGISNERIGNYKEAESHYLRGYELLKQERNSMGMLFLYGYRELLLDKCIAFLSNKPQIEHVSDHPLTFKFADSKTYSEIQSIFQKTLLSIHRNRTGTVKEICNNLEMSIRLYFIYQNRFGIEKGSNAEHIKKSEHFENYISALLPLKWREANKQFDHDLFNYLLKKYSHNKTRIAEILDVSVLTVINKTANLE